MKKARTLVAMLSVATSTACGTEIVRAILNGSPDATVIVVPPIACSSKPKLVSRLDALSIQVSEDVRYKRSGYYYGFPQDERLAIAALPDNGSLVAWVNAAGTTVHVTPLAADSTRSGPDITFEGTEISGLVAHDDGFAVLTRRPDLGEPLDNGQAVQATYLVRFRNGREAFAVALTGTKSISEGADNEKRDYPTGVSGRLAWNGTHYGAYFTARGTPGDRLNGATFDKMVYVDDAGMIVSGGWRSACRTSLGTRIVSDGAGFKAFCMSDGTSNFDAPAGVNIAFNGANTKRLAPESLYPGSVSASNLGAQLPGYAGGNFGSAIRLKDSYLISWASRGVSKSNDDYPGYDLHEPVFMRISENGQRWSPRTWPFHVGELEPGFAPKVDAVNVHAAPYLDGALVVWETIDTPVFRPSAGFSAGGYGGTHFRLIDMPISSWDGGLAPAVGDDALIVATSDEEVTPEGLAPNGPDDIIEYPNGDLGWALVPELPRDFQNVLAANAIPSVAPIPVIKVVRFAYCTP